MERAEATKKRKFASCNATRCLSEVCLVERSRKPPHQRLSEEEWLCVHHVQSLSRAKRRRPRSHSLVLAKRSNESSNVNEGDPWTLFSRS
jgi:hypothetical protein